MQFCNASSLKLNDPGIFNIECVIGGQIFSNVLCNLGANINLMPSSIFNHLGIGEMKPTIIALQMTDIFVTHPRGIVEDVLVKVGKFIFPANFSVLEMLEDKNLPLILGRLFFATGRALIDVQGGDLTFRVNGGENTISTYGAMKQPS